jgi:hypothetical protein
MSGAMFDFRSFIEGIDLSVHSYRVTKVESTSDPKAFEVFAAPNLSTGDASIGIGADLSIGMWVAWLPTFGLLRMNVNLDMGKDSAGGEHFNFLVQVANQLNQFAWDRIAKVSIVLDGEQGTNIACVAYALLLPAKLSDTQDVQRIVAAHMARIYTEAVQCSVDLYNALNKMEAEGIDFPEHRPAVLQ